MKRPFAVRKTFLFVSKLVLTLMVIGTASAEAIGKISFAHGLVTRVSVAGQQDIINKGTLIETGDRVITINKAFALIRFVDGTQIALRPGSELRIVAYTYIEDEPDKDNAEFELISGGMRSVSGKIGKRNEANDYRVKSGGSYIGIRGTDYFATSCKTDRECEERFAPNYVPGLYAAVEDGAIVIGNTAGEMSVAKGQSAYAGTGTATLLAQTPPGLKFTLPGDGEACLAGN